MAMQRQIRGATQATQEGRTLAARELDINTTDWRLAAHDGATAGGVPHPNWRDVVNNEYTYAAATGTNSIAITLAKAPAAYAAGQGFKFKAANTVTGSATLNVNSLGAKTIKKKDVRNGTIAALSAGDIIAGGIYSVFYDGTDMILESVDGGGVANWSYGSATPSGTSFSIATGLAGVSDFEAFFAGMTATGSQGFLVRIGDSGGIEATGYNGYSNVQSFTTGIAGGTCSATGYYGFLRLALADNANRWASMFSGGNSTSNEAGAVVKDLSDRKSVV